MLGWSSYLFGNAFVVLRLALDEKTSASKPVFLIFTFMETEYAKHFAKHLSPVLG